MSVRLLLLIAATSGFVLGWVLPVVDDYRGWQAFRVALSPLWPYERFVIEGWHNKVLTAASGLTNVLFVWLLVDSLTVRKTPARAAAWALVGATVLNLYWLVLAGEAVTDLAVGYYVWVVSFPLLALVARHADGR